MFNFSSFYRLEKPQYDSMISGNANKPVCDIYGSAHLLRLTVKLNNFLNMTNITSENDVQLIEGVMKDLLVFLETNRAKYFTSKNYVEAPEDYLKSATLE